MTRPIFYLIGGLLMAALLGIAVFGQKGFFPDAYSARGCLVGVFLMMQWQRSRYGALVTRHVLISGLTGAFLGGIAGRFLLPMPPGWHGETLMVMPSTLFHTALIVTSFHYLTLGRGRMP